MEADGLLLEGEVDAWLELEFAEAKGRLGKNLEKGPLLRSKEVAPGREWCLMLVQIRRWFEKIQLSNFVLGGPEQVNGRREQAGSWRARQQTLSPQCAN